MWRPLPRAISRMPHNLRHVSATRDKTLYLSHVKEDTKVVLVAPDGLWPHRRPHTPQGGPVAGTSRARPRRSPLRSASLLALGLYGKRGVILETRP
jgi:hypothetical protein